MNDGAEWDVYLCNVNDHPASIVLDLSLRKKAPDPERPWLLFVWIKLQESNEGGLGCRSELDSLVQVENSLCEDLDTSCGAMFCGTITNLGRREFYFYVLVTEGVEEAVIRSLSSSPQYKFQIGFEHDPSWKQYLDVLYPPEDELERMANRRVLELLDKHGDQSFKTRPVQHWIFFRNAADREAFLKESALKGYDRPYSYEIEHRDDRFCACVSRDQTTEPDVIDGSIMELRQLAARFNGVYDGWETQVINDDEVAPPKPN